MVDIAVFTYDPPLASLRSCFQQLTPTTLFGWLQECSWAFAWESKKALRQPLANDWLAQENEAEQTQEDKNKTGAKEF